MTESNLSGLDAKIHKAKGDETLERRLFETLKKGDEKMTGGREEEG